MSHGTESVEVLIIGGGVIGSSIAYHVARLGRTVLVVERQEIAVEPAASWVSAVLPLSVVDNSFSPTRLTILLDLAYCIF